MRVRDHLARPSRRVASARSATTPRRRSNPSDESPQSASRWPQPLSRTTNISFFCCASRAPIRLPALATNFRPDYSPRWKTMSVGLKCSLATGARSCNEDCDTRRMSTLWGENSVPSLSLFFRNRAVSLRAASSLNRRCLA